MLSGIDDRLSLIGVMATAITDCKWAGNPQWYDLYPEIAGMTKARMGMPVVWEREHPDSRPYVANPLLPNSYQGFHPLSLIASRPAYNFVGGISFVHVATKGLAIPSPRVAQAWYDSDVISDSWEHVGIISQSVVAVTAVVGLFFLWKYTGETKELRKATAEQIEKSIIPYVTLEFESDEPLVAAISAAKAQLTQSPPAPAVHLKENTIRFVNIGKGPAVKLVYRIESDQRRLVHTYPHLNPTESFAPPLGKLGEGQAECVDIEYRSLTGRVYTSKLKLERRQSHERNKWVVTDVGIGESAHQQDQMN